MDDPTERRATDHGEEFPERLEPLPVVLAPDAVIEIPLDHPDLFTRGVPTYGGKPMGKILPTAAEFSFVARLGVGLESMPGHEGSHSA